MVNKVFYKEILSSEKLFQKNSPPFFHSIELPPWFSQLRNNTEARFIENKDTVQISIDAGFQHGRVIDIEVGCKETSLM